MRLDYDDHWLFGKMIVVSLLIVATGCNLWFFLGSLTDSNLELGLPYRVVSTMGALSPVIIFFSAFALIPELRSRLIEVVCLGILVMIVWLLSLNFAESQSPAGDDESLYFTSLAFPLLLLISGFVLLIRKTGGPIRVYFILGLMFSPLFCAPLEKTVPWILLFSGPLLQNLLSGLISILFALGFGLMTMFLAYLLLKNEVPRDRDAKVSSDEL